MSRVSYADKARGVARAASITDPDPDDLGWTVVDRKKDKNKVPSIVKAPALTQPDEIVLTDDEFPALPSSDDEVVVTKVVPPREQFTSIIQEKTKRPGFRNVNVAALAAPSSPSAMKPLPATTAPSGHSTVVASFMQNWQNKVDRFNSQTFDLERVTTKAAHGLPLQTDNCPDLQRLSTLKVNVKALENARAVLRKAARIIAAVDEDVRDNILQLAKPGGLFKILMEGEGYHLAVQHYSATNAPSSVVQYASLMKHFIVSYFNCYKEDCYEAVPALTEIQLSSKVSRIETYLKNATATGKRDIKHDKHVRQEVKVKEAAGRIPNVEDYRQVVQISHKFLKKAYRACLTDRQTNSPIWNCQLKQFSEIIQRAMWAVRVNFMFNSDGQRANQYEELLQKEFYLMLVEKKHDSNGRIVLQDVDKECLGSSERTSFTLTRVNGFRTKAERHPDKYACHIRRIPNKVDKRVRDKDNLWCRWNNVDQKSVWFIVHYCLELLPKVGYIAEQNDVQFDQRFMFHHTKTLKPMNGTVILQDMANFYNWHAKKKGFATVQSKTGATVWRHAFATSEFQKFDAKTDYGWCNTDQEAARAIAFKMNTSAEEILTTYTTRINVSGEAQNTDRAPHQTEFVIDMMNVPSDTDDDEQNIVTPVAQRKRKKINSDDDDDDDNDDHIDEDGDDTRKRPAKKKTP